jgi:hypothetical protein
MFKKETLIKIGGTMPIVPLLPIGALILLFAIAPLAAADPYLGGIPLITANGTSGTVTGDLWLDAYPGFDYAYSTPVVWNSTLPCDPDDIVWARLYVDVYIGHMENNYPLKVTTKFDGDGDGLNYVTLGSETMNTNYVFPYNNGTWDGQGPIWLNNHSNRVTSDFLMWYDVSDDITSSTVSTRVNDSKPDGTQPSDGRVKSIILVVAYNNNQSCNVTHYWVSQGHDTDSYVTDEAGRPYTGNTIFDTSAVYTPGEANLTVLPLASFNGNYTFNSDTMQLPWANPRQGSYFQRQSWNVTSLISGNSYMTYGRNETDTDRNYSGYFKIPLALLTVKDESLIYDFSNNTLGRAGICLFAYRDQASGLPPTVNNDPNNEFSTTEYNKIKYDDQNFQPDMTATEGKHAAHRFVFNVSCCFNVSNLDAINVTWNGKGYHDDPEADDGVNLYIWNGTGYETLATSNDEDELILTGEKTTNLGNYINNDKVIVLAEQKYPDDGLGSHSTIETDYIRLVLKS